ncbi:MAG: glutathione transferase GstA [Stappiaceae bacterium]
MKLYYKPGACSLSAHIVLNEIGADFEIDKVDTQNGRTENGEDFPTINPNGYVPALRLDDDAILFEAPAVLQYLAEQSKETNLLPPVGSVDRARVQQYLNFISSELHKAFAPFFSDNPPQGAAHEAAVAKVATKFDYIESLLSDGRSYVLGDTFNVADAYLFVIASWAGPTRIGLDRWPHLSGFVERVGERPSVVKSMRAEGLLN